jgi:FHS family L-fucose permease-like MFS transporter
VPGQGNTLSIENLKTPYVALAIVLLALAVLIGAIRMPTIKNEALQSDTEGNAMTTKRRSVFSYPQLVLGMLAIFIYVGTEVTIQSNLGALLELKDIKGIDHTQVDKYISLYWGSLMIGRISGSLSTFNLKKSIYNVLSVLVPFMVFGIVLFFNALRGTVVNDLSIYALWIGLFIVVKFIGQEKPAKTLLLFSLAAMLFMAVGLFTHGDIALFSFLSGGLFCSVMWPCIFNLAIAGLGKYTNQGSSLLIMMILGGAILPPLQGTLADSVGIHPSYWVPLVGFGYLAWYGFFVKRLLQKQGINYDTTVDDRH